MQRKLYLLTAHCIVCCKFPVRFLQRIEKRMTSKNSKVKTVQLHQDVYDRLAEEKNSESESFNDILKRLLGMVKEDTLLPNRTPTEYGAVIEIEDAEQYESVFFTEEELAEQLVKVEGNINGGDTETEVYTRVYGDGHIKRLGGVDITVEPEKTIKLLIFAKTREELDKKVEKVEKGFVAAYNRKEKEKAEAEKQQGLENPHVSIDECPGTISYRSIYCYNPEETDIIMACCGDKTRKVRVGGAINEKSKGG